jgi:Na+:H+ antiporter, NhaA family
MPSNTMYKQLFGVAMLGGIGFTMSIFTSTLSYHADNLQTISKVAIICGSALSSVFGYLYLKYMKPVPVPQITTQQSKLTALEESLLSNPTAAI